MNRRLLSYFDWPLLCAALLLIAFGSVAVYSSSQPRFGEAIIRKHLLLTAISCAAMVVVAVTNFELFDRLRWWLYGANLALLLAVLIFGRNVRGAQRWLDLGGFSLQPSEFSKLFLTLVLASLLARHHHELHSPRVLLKAFGLVALPALLVFKQPHLGNALALFVLLFGMLFIAGARMAQLLIAGGIGIALLGFVWGSGLIRPQQKARIQSFVASDGSGRDADWQARQSRIAIGSGGLLGQGWRRGSQNQLGFVPDNHTDFILAAIGEEFGFVGTATVLALMCFLLWRALVIARMTEILFGALVASGLFIWMAFQSFVNVAMTLQLAPVTGLPMPFVSYGGSSMLLSLLCVGVLESIAMRRKRMAF